MNSTQTLAGTARPSHRNSVVATAVASLSLAGCLATAPTIGGGSATPITGSAAGASTSGANSGLERCPETLGTLRIEENTSAPWYGYYYSNYRLGSTVPLLRTMIQQSNCFVIVERGRSMNTIRNERGEMRGEEGRAGSNFGTGQQVGADYVLSPEIMMSNRSRDGTVSAVTSRLTGLLGSAATAATGSMSTNEAGTTLILVDVRSSVQIAAAEGYSKNTDFGLVGSLWGSGTALSGSSYANTPQGKVIVAAFVDSYNKMVRGLREYKAQTVKGGLGTGGRLGVQGGSTAASQEIGKPAAKK